jgi:hypothetical protein
VRCSARQQERAIEAALSGGHRGGHENDISGPDGTPDPRNHQDLGWLRGSDGAAQESNLPSRGLHDLTGFEDKTRWCWLIAAVQQLRIEAVALRDGQCD